MVKVWNHDTERLEHEAAIIEKEMQIGIRVGTLSAQGLKEMQRAVELRRAELDRRNKDPHPAIARIKAAWPELSGAEQGELLDWISRQERSLASASHKVDC